MSKSNFVYKREDIKDYFSRHENITDIEYNLLPFEIQMAYCDRLYGRFIKMAEFDRMTVMKGKIDKKHNKYIEINGCKARNFEAVTPEILIIRISNDSYEVSEDAENKIAYYLELLINAKLNVFENYYKRFCMSQIRAMKKGKEISFTNFDAHNILDKILNGNLEELDLSRQEMNRIMEVQLIFVLEDIKNNKEVDLPNNLPDKYKDYIQKYKKSLEKETKVAKKELKNN